MRKIIFFDIQRVCELNEGTFCPFRRSFFNLLLSLMNIGFLRTAIATALIDYSTEKPFVFQTRRTTIMKKGSFANVGV